MEVTNCFYYVVMVALIAATEPFIGDNGNDFETPCGNAPEIPHGFTRRISELTVVHIDNDGAPTERVAYKAEYACTTGYTITGNGTIECNVSSRLWQNPPTCKLLTASTRKQNAVGSTKAPGATYRPELATKATEAVTACKYGLKKPHTMCLDNSRQFVEVLASPIKEIIDLHNYYRGWKVTAQVNPKAKVMPNLEWDGDLAYEAERWAAQCKWYPSEEQNTDLPNRGPGKPAWEVGQNMAKSENREITWTQAIDEWGAEVKNWRYGWKDNEGGDVGRYTQIIWAETLYVGCGKVKCRGQQYFFVCYYAPAGNIGSPENGMDPFIYPYEKASS